MENFKQRIIPVFNTVGTDNQGNEGQLLRVEVMLVDCMVTQIYVRRLHLEEGMAVVPTNDLLTFMKDLLTSLSSRFGAQLYILLPGFRIFHDGIARISLVDQQIYIIRNEL